MIVTATCCVAFDDNVYLQYLATVSISTFQIRHCQRSFPWFILMTCKQDPSEIWTFSVYTTELLQTHAHTKKNSPTHSTTVLDRLYRTRKTRHGLTHAVRWFLEICLTQLHIRTADSCSWTSQDSELGGRIIEGPEAISCQDRRPLQSDRAKSRKWFILSWLWLGLPVKWWLMFCLFLFFPFLFQHTLQPVKQKWTDFYTIWLRSQTNGEIDTSVSHCANERQGQIAMERDE